MKHDRDAISKLQKAVHQGTFTLLHNSEVLVVYTLGKNQNMLIYLLWKW